MSVSKRLRFEVLRRDNHTCRYCGASAPAVELHVDHVLPVALGGEDKASNLVASCSDCNSGKSSVPPDAALVADVSADSLRWAAAIARAGMEAEERAAEAAEYVKAFDHKWLHEPWSDERRSERDMWHLPDNCDVAVRDLYYRGLPLALMLEAFEIADTARGIGRYSAFKYFLGVCNNKLSDVHDRAREIAGIL